jgi:hypothetical protein
MAEEISGSAWQRFGHDPRLPANAMLRAADADRAVVSDVLAAAYAEGRLDRDELDERNDRLTTTKTLGELRTLVDDLLPAVAAAPSPAALRAEAERRYLKRRQDALAAFLIPTLICWVIWAWVLIGPGGTPFPWPLFVTIGTGWTWVQLVTTRERAVAELEQQLLRKEAKRQRRLGHGGHG